jgi:hypothetical protein
MVVLRRKEIIRYLGILGISIYSYEVHGNVFPKQIHRDIFRHEILFENHKEKKFVNIITPLIFRLCTVQCNIFACELIVTDV